MNRFILQIGHAVAQAIIPEKRMPELGLALKLRRMFADYEIDRVIDVGANRGQYRNFLRYRVGFTGQIESFEPLPDLAGDLARQAAADAKWSIHACALGSAPGRLDINVMQETMFSSFLSPRAGDNARLNSKNTVVKTVTVPVQTLDEVFADTHGLERTYLKLDTQGFDLQVLAGGTQTIGHIKILQAELSFRPFYNGMPPLNEALKAFEDQGFSVADMFLGTTDGAHHAMEFDCILTR